MVAVGISRGVKTGSRLDPLAIEVKAATVFEAADDFGWTLDSEQAVKDDKGKPKPVGGGEGQAGRPSQINHGNVTPSIESHAGGVTADEIVATTVLSFIALRRLCFPVDHKGDSIDPGARREIEGAARTSLAALGLAATVLAFEDGFDLRSRCVLAPVAGQEFEMLRRSGADPRRFSLDHDEALALVAEASGVSSSLGLPWMSEELLLQPADRLVDLIERSRKLTEPSAGDGAGSKP